MKNFISKIVIISIFVFGFSLFTSNKIEAAVTASINASSTNVLVGSGQVTIKYSSSGADSCTLNGSSVSNSGTYYFTPSSVGSFTFRIECKHLVVEPTGKCTGRVVGSTQCNGSDGDGPDEGMYCSSFTTKDTCMPPSCSSWFHHGCNWSAY